jgi:hypothetical protein
MEIINPLGRSKSIKLGMKKLFVSFKKHGDGIIFTEGVMSDYVLRGRRLTFVIDVGRLYFYVSDKEGDGFMISNCSNGGGTIISKTLVKHIYSSLPIVKRNGPRFNIRLSNTRINDSATFEILIHQKL